MKSKRCLIFVTALLAACFAACQYANLPLISPNDGGGTTEVRLGKSDFFLKLPDDFEMTEARGKEGQLGYHLKPKDTASTMSAFIEIKHGMPITVAEPSKRSPRSFARAGFGGKETVWLIEKTETGYFVAFTSEHGDLNATASSKDENEVKKLISIIATLKNGR